MIDIIVASIIIAVVILLVLNDFVKKNKIQKTMPAIRVQIPNKDDDNIVYNGVLTQSHLDEVDKLLISANRKPLNYNIETLTQNQFDYLIKNHLEINVCS